MVDHSSGTILIGVYEHITGGGLAGQELPPSLAREGAAMRRAVAEDFTSLDTVRVVMTLDTRQQNEPGPWEIVRVEANGPGPIELISNREVDAIILIAPETRDVLEHLLEDCEARGLRTLGSSAEAVRLTSSKLMMNRALSRAGVRVPPARLIGPWLTGPRGPVFLEVVRRDDPNVPAWPTPAAWTRGPIPTPTRFEAALAVDHERAELLWPGPLVIKPDDGAGCLETRYVANPVELMGTDWRQSGRIANPHVAGVPMSASFLVDRDGQPYLVGVGEQKIVLQNGFYHYLGGSVPAGAPELAEEARRAVRAIEGLRGWVGVDFIWEPGGRACVLDVNPRLTTSYVGLRRLLRPGELAEAWLTAIEAPDRMTAFELARRVHEQPTVRFRADGSPHDGD